MTVAEGVYVPDGKGIVSRTPRTLIASASVDSTVRLWERAENQGKYNYVDKFQIYFALQACLQCYHSTIFHAMSFPDEFSCIQTLSFGTGFILDISWIILPNTSGTNFLY